MYVSLLSDIGEIKKVSQNFSDIVPLVESNIDAIGKNIKFMMCDEIASLHDTILLKST